LPRQFEGPVDFSRLAHEWVARLNEIGQKHEFSSTIEMLDAFRYGKINQSHGLRGWAAIGLFL